MKRISFWLLAFASVLLFNCKGDDSPSAQTRTELIKASGWQLSRITTTDGQTVANSKLNASTLIIYALDIQFKDNNVVRAADKVSKQIINAGTWTFIESDTKIDVNVTGFSGKFEVVELTTTKLVLRNKIPVSGVDTDGNMEFVPSL
ncbi:MAG: hypothetical protein U0Y10_17415 [Spirosomataceae bacterium]